MMRKPGYFIEEYADAHFTHGGIGVTDAEKILKREGYSVIRFPFHFSFSIKARIIRFLHLCKTFFMIPRGSVVVYIFPLHARIYKLLIRCLHFRKSIRLVCFIADIDGLKDGNKKLLNKEIREFKKNNFFIVHNTPMQAWIKKIVPDGRCSAIEFFDFLTKPVIKSRTKNKSLAFAGNLAKSSFLEQVQSLDLVFNIYGEGVTQKMTDQSNVSYKGVFDPYAMPGLIEGAFGLVWDGNSIDGMGGSLGSYMQYISHHKLSLYILAGLPVISFAGAGSAELVEKYRIGFCVNSLHEVSARIEAVNEETYRQWIHNTKELAASISRGNNLKRALEQIGLIDPS